MTSDFIIPMTKREIELAEAFLLNVRRLGQEKRYAYEIEIINKEKANGWKKRYSENMKGVNI
jgi:hypothetical protein